MVAIMKKESEIRDEIYDYLSKSGHLVWKDRQVVRKPTKGTMQKSNGTPDIMMILAPTGRFLGIEVKSEKGKLRPEQIVFRDRANLSGALCFVATSVEDVILKLSELIRPSERNRINPFILP